MNTIDASDALRKLQHTELEILLVIQAFCAEHGIRWFIDSGTVLGAARHKGFIPWDDDIDIGMLRSDYDAFLRLAEQEFPQGYSVHTFKNTPGYAGMFAKVYKDGTKFHTQETVDAGCDQGIFVDVFPYDVLSPDKEKSAFQRRNAKIWQSISYLHHSRDIVVPHKGALGSLERTMCKAAHGVAARVFDRDTIYARFHRSILPAEVHEDDVVLPLAWPNIQGYRVSDLLPASMLSFEGHLFPAPAKWEHYLEQMYGTWQDLPAPEDRRTHLPLLLDFGDGTGWKRGE